MSVAPPKKNIFQILAENQSVQHDLVKEAFNTARTTNRPPEVVLVETGVPEETVYEAQAQTLGLPFVDVRTKPFSAETQALIPDDMRDRLGATPIEVDGKKLTVALKKPQDIFARDNIQSRTGMTVQVVMVAPNHLEQWKTGAFNQLETVNEEDLDNGRFTAELDELLGGLKPVEADASKKNPKKKDTKFQDEEQQDVDLTNQSNVSGGAAADASLADEAPIIRIVNTILMYAIKDGASDIHVEPQQKGVRVRYRIDGVLHEQMKVPQYVLNPLVSRLKIMGDMNIAERRIPQDGRIHLKMHNKEYDLRVNVCPTSYGEKVVMRILDKSSVQIGLEKLGLYPDTEEQLLDICYQPYGCFMICGPTGSGKTTTLYSILNVVNSVEKNVMTVEDPIEYQLPGLSQVHVNRKAGLSFATALRAFLRQDPDIIMVGEIRDLETAEIAIQAALTGHLVLSTIHTNDAPSVATRLGDMGVEPFLVSASLVGTLAQRLTRRLCPKCKESYEPQRELLTRFGYDPLLRSDGNFAKGAGCDNCKQTGYKGRMGLYELMRVNDELGEMIVRRAPVAELRETARASGMRTLQEDGFRRCMDGRTTVEEVMRVVFTGGH